MATLNEVKATVRNLDTLRKTICQQHKQATPPQFRDIACDDCPVDHICDGLNLIERRQRLIDLEEADKERRQRRGKKRIK